LPSGGEHVTRTIGFGPDKKLYVAIGSTCNACNESNSLRAAISVMNKDGSDLHPYATGLRNSVFFTWHNNQLWATDNGRDFLGDNVPPDDVNVIESGKFYGWPNCYGQKIQDKKVDASATAAAKCKNSTAPVIEIPAHSAPLGLSFVPDTADWPADWRGNLLVAYHGSWNRSVPTGYKVVRYRFDSQGHPQPAQDFISGWLVSGGAVGRPVDLVFHDQALYITDDKAGVIYRVTYQGSQPVSTACRPTGCSGQICADHDVVSDCVYKPEFQCYGTARCVQATDASCAWLDTPELKACLDSFPKNS
jgi:glucose/arabinose dehydrogenase